MWAPAELFDSARRGACAGCIAGTQATGKLAEITPKRCMIALKCL